MTGSRETTTRPIVSTSGRSLSYARIVTDRSFSTTRPSSPHLALHVPDDELEPYLELGWEDPPFTRTRGGYTPHFTPRAAYAAMISRLDRYVGNVLRLLDELGIADETIVVFTSDNGATHLSDEVDCEFFDSVGELRGLKGSLYEGGIRVPTLVRWPGRVQAGSSSGYVSGFEDWAPTLVELTAPKQTSIPQGDGVSLTPTLLGKQQEPRPLLYREFPGYGGQQSIRVGDWKAIRQNMSRGELAVELYDLATDISEERNVAEEHPDIVARLTALMDEQHAPSELFPLTPLDAAPRD